MSKKIKLTQGKFAIVDDDDYEKLNKFKWSCNNYGYATRCYQSKTLLMHRIVNETLTGYETDHINGDKLDNRKENLRVVTHRENSLNRPKNKNNTSGHKGVFWDKRKSRWYAKIEVWGEQHFLGYSESIDGAIKLRKKGEENYYVGI